LPVAIGQSKSKTHGSMSSSGEKRYQLMWVQSSFVDSALKALPRVWISL